MKKLFMNELQFKHKNLPRHRAYTYQLSQTSHRLMQCLYGKIVPACAYGRVIDTGCIVNLYGNRAYL